MAEVDILMQEKQDDGSYNQLYPITKASNVNYTNSALSGVSNAKQGLDSIVNTLGDINLNNYFTKTQTLTSTTAALFGLGTDAVPDDVLKILSRFQSGLGNEYLWSVSAVVEKEIAYGSSNRIYLCSTQQAVKNDVQYSESILVNDKGEVSLKDPTSISLSKVVSTPNVLSGKYFLNPSPQTEDDWIIGNSIVKISDGATISVLGRATLYVGNGNGTVSYLGLGDTIKYVNSPSVDAYPPSVPDEYTYIPLGKLGNFARMETGSYIGTDKYGADNPNSLTFKFVPKFVLIFSGGDNNSVSFGFAFLTSEGGYSYNPAGSNGQWFYVGEITPSFGTNKVTWSANSARTQMNISYSYYYVAIG